MSNVAAPVVEAPAKVIGFARHNKVAFALLLLALVILFFRYSRQIGAFLGNTLGRVPVLGPFLLKLMTPAAALVLVMLASGDAFAAGPLSALEVKGYGIVGLIVTALCGAGVGIAYQLGKEYSEELKSDSGETSLSITPTAATQLKSLSIRSRSATFEGLWKRATSMTAKLTVGVDQPGAGGAVIPEDQLPRIVSSIRINSEVFGDILPSNSGSGPVYKQIMEFVGAGHQNPHGARALVAAADGDTALTLYMTYYFAPMWGERAAQDFAIWLGWLQRTSLELTIGATTALDGVSTGAVIEATSAFSAWVNYVYDKRNAVPILSVWRLFNHGAGSSTIYARDWLNPHGLKVDVQRVCRVAGIYYLSNLLGLGGCNTLENVTKLSCAVLGITELPHVDALVETHLRAMGGLRGPKGGTHATSAPHDRAGNPYTMLGTPSGSLLDATLTYLALLCPSKRQELSRLPLAEIGSDLRIDATFTAVPSSGNHPVLVNTIQAIAREAAANLAFMAGRRLGETPLADGRTTGQLKGQGYSEYDWAVMPTELVG